MGEPPLSLAHPAATHNVQVCGGGKFAEQNWIETLD
jgi:hypothetical protein